MFGVKFRVWFLHGFLVLSLSACSLFRHDQEQKEPTEVVDASQEPEQQDLNLKYLENEISKVNSKVEALETKLSILSNSVQTLSARNSQPAIIAEQEAAPATDVAAENTEHSEHADLSVEAAFKNAMTVFQSGKFAESTTYFSAIARDYPKHLLASHALYWAGEASAREQKWALAQKNWEELVMRFPQSAYYSDALAGLSKTYGEQKNTEKAEEYKQKLLQTFPTSPAASQFITKEQPIQD